MAWFLCAQCSWNLITWRKGDHGLGWCNHTIKAEPWCVILAVMLILCIYSNWAPERIFPMCVCVYVWMFMWVHDTWRELGVTLLRQVDQPGWPVLTSWYVSFAGGCWGAHTVLMPAWLMARYLSVSLAKCTVLYNCFMVFPAKVLQSRFLRSVAVTLIILINCSFIQYILKHAVQCSSTIMMFFHMWTDYFKMMCLQAHTVF